VPTLSYTCFPHNHPRQSLAFDALRTCAQLAYELFAATREQAPAALAEAAQLLHTHALLVRPATLGLGSLAGPLVKRLAGGRRSARFPCTAVPGSTVVRATHFTRQHLG
jgi:hypothetical protein